jgi:hypothetical protein
MTNPDTAHWGPAANREIDDANYKWACDHVFDPLDEPDAADYFLDLNRPGAIYTGPVGSFEVLRRRTDGNLRTITEEAADLFLRKDPSWILQQVDENGCCIQEEQ